MLILESKEFFDKLIHLTDECFSLLPKESQLTERESTLSKFNVEYNRLAKEKDSNN